MSDLVVFGCPVANRSWVLSEWWQAITRQMVRSRWKAAFVYTHSEDDTLGKLQQMADWHDVHIIDAGESPRTRVDMNEHRWPREHVEKMAEWRNMLLDYCIEQDADWFFSVDSDIILPPDAFYQLSKHRVSAVSPLVNMAGHLDPGSIAWNFMDWNDGTGQTPQAVRRGVTAFGGRAFRVHVIMAAMLIHRSAFDVRWEAHDQGEDVGWSANAMRCGHAVYIDPQVICNHFMRPVPS